MTLAIGGRLIVHAPLSDDISMIAFSREWSWNWFTKGLADYFIVYPEYYEPQSNFIRPVSNILYWLFGILIPADWPFLSNRVQLIVLNFGTLAAISSILSSLIYRISASWRIAGLAAVASFLIPTFWTTPTTTYTSFVFDELSILFCLFALIAFDVRRYVQMAIMLTLALMTKEISFPIVLTFGIVFLATRNWLALLAPLIATLLWGTLRLIGFGIHAEGVYVFGGHETSSLQLLGAKAQNIGTLPLGPVFFEAIFTPSGLDLLHQSGALLIINILLYGIILMSMLRSQIVRRGIMPTLRRMRIQADANEFHSDLLTLRNERLVFLSGISALMSFFFVAYVGSNYRYAFSFLPFLYIALAGANLKRALRIISFLLIGIGSSIASAPYIQNLRSNSEFDVFRYRVMRDLTNELQAHRGSIRIAIFNDFVLGYANPEAVKIISHFDGIIFRGTSLYLDGCDIKEFKSISTQISTDANQTFISTTISQCGQFTFEDSPKLANFVKGNQILRNDDMSYTFIPSHNDRGDPPLKTWSGKNLTAITKNMDLLYFDFEKDRWVFIKASK